MYCIEKQGINYSSDEHEQYYKLIDEKLSNILLEETVNHCNYYKNILKEDTFGAFEKIVNLLQGEVQFFYENLFYTQKILSFINEFYENETYPTDLMFLRTFLGTAASNMVLIACKLFYDGSIDTTKGENISFNYLKQFIYDNSKSRDIVPSEINQSVKNQMKIVKSELPLLTELRNSYIAHYQVKADNIEMKGGEETTELNTQSLQKIYDSACVILEELTLMYFQGKDIGEYNFIRYQGFRETVCQNLIIDNMQKTDIDSFFDYLRTHYIEEITK